MELEDAHSYIRKHLSTDAGKYYSPGTDLNIGVGQLYQGIQFPIFNRSSAAYDTVKGCVYVLSHECDLDQSNTRPFNEYALVVPIIYFDSWFKRFSKAYESSPEFVTSFLARVARREISRLFYFPSVDTNLPFGGLVYWNQITHTHISSFQSGVAKRLCSVTAYGLGVVDKMIENHLLRPKDNRLALIKR